MNKQKDLFETIKWPSEFIVEYNDGKEQALSSSKGIIWDEGKDLDGKDENRANISCALKKKSPSQQKYRMVEFFVDEVKQFKTLSGSTIWVQSA